MEKQTNAHLAAQLISSRVPAFKPLIGIVLGSGLGSFADALKDRVSFSYLDLPGFPIPTVYGHCGNLILGNYNDIGIICLQGRSHPYEGQSYEMVKTYVRTLRLLGCEYFIATNASGSLREDVGPGELMLISDHINFQSSNPLIGPNDEEFGPRFFALDNAYDKSLRDIFLKVAAHENIPLHQGIYVSVLGPNYETAAEIRAFKMWGADAVGMSTVPEVLVATHCGMKTAVIATITNYATGLIGSFHSHESVVATAAQSSAKLSHLLLAFINDLKKNL